MNIYYPQARAILQVIFDGFGDTARDSPINIIPCLPKSLTVHRNSYSQADSWEVMFDVGDLPIDPTLIRSGAIELYLFQLLEVEQRIIDRRDPLAALDDAATTPRDPVDSALLSLGSDQTSGSTEGRVARDRFTYGNRPIIAGLFDEASIELSGDGKWMSITGQDYTGHLISLQWPPTEDGRARRIPVGKRLDLLLQDILDEADPDGRLQIVTRGVDAAALPIVGVGDVPGNKRGIAVTADTNYWEVMYKLAVRHGYILYVESLDVVLAAPRNLDADSAGRIKRLAWGQNLESLRLSRELGKTQSPTIVVRGYDPVERKIVEVEYPEGEYHRAAKAKDKTSKRNAVKETTRVSKKSGKVSTTIRKRDEYQIIPAQGVTSRAVMEQMARTYYQMRGRSERKVVATTRDLRDMSGSDMLTLTAGDACWITWDDFNQELLRNPRVSAGAKLDHLVSKGFNAEIAGVIVTSFERLEALDRPLRLKEATISYSAEDGVTIEMELADFIVLDGQRDAENNPTSSADRARAKARGADGRPVGMTAAQETAAQKRSNAR